MFISRRVQPIPQDFDYAIDWAGLRYDELESYLRPVMPPELVLPQLPSPPPEEIDPPLLSSLDPALRGTPSQAQRGMLPAHFPALPGKHTYQATPVFTERQADPKSMREKATEEARLGEEALRRLLAASNATHPRPGGGAAGASSSRPQTGGKRVKLGWWQGDGEEMWQNTLSKLMEGDDAASPGDITGLVNFEKQYWRKGAGKDRRDGGMPAAVDVDVVMT